MRFLKHNLTSPVLVAVLVISIFTLLFAASISYRQIRTLKDSEKAVVRAYNIYVELEQLSSYALYAEAGQRGFLLTRDSIFLHPYFEALEKVKWSFARLNSLTTDNYREKRSLDTIVFLINQRFNFLEHVLDRNDYEVNLSDTLKTFMMRGRELMNLSLTQIDKMIFKELQVLRQRETDHKNDAKLSPYTILFIVVFALLVFIVAYYKINMDLKGLAKNNNQLMIHNKIFEHSEQIADISHWYWNIKENKLTYSLNLYRLLGCQINEFEPTFENFLSFVHPADRHLLLKQQKALQEYSPSMTLFRIIRRDGEVRHFKSIGKQITDNFGTSFSIGINSDITDQYTKDKMIGEKLADLEKSNKQLSAFSHIASHDLQEPLRKVQTFISRIKPGDTESFPENIKEYLQGIKKEIIRMQKFITDLLLYSRASKADKTFERADLNEILENTKRELSHRIEEKNVIIHSGNDLPVLEVIPFQMQQLFNNLISNSIKYSKTDRHPIIDIASEIVLSKDIPGYTGDSDVRYYKLSFTDNGIGFDQQYAEKIFTLFYRLHSNNEYTGTGIGLAICRIIIENHKGFITAEGVPGVGSTFSIFIPMRKS